LIYGTAEYLNLNNHKETSYKERLRIQALEQEKDERLKIYTLYNRCLWESIWSIVIDLWISLY